LVLGRSDNKVLWHPVFEDFASYFRGDGKVPASAPTAAVGRPGEG
jgi:hypothetical protein